MHVCRPSSILVRHPAPVTLRPAGNYHQSSFRLINFSKLHVGLKNNENEAQRIPYFADFDQIFQFFIKKAALLFSMDTQRCFFFICSILSIKQLKSCSPRLNQGFVGSSPYYVVR